MIRSHDAGNWTLQIKYPQLRDNGVYECQINTEPKMSLSYTLNVVGECYHTNFLFTILPLKCHLTGILKALVNDGLSRLKEKATEMFNGKVTRGLRHIILLIYNDEMEERLKFSLLFVQNAEGKFYLKLILEHTNLMNLTNCWKTLLV